MCFFFFFYFKHLSIKCLNSNDSLENLMDNIKACIGYEFNRVSMLNTLPFKYISFTIRYVIEPSASLLEEQPI